MGLQPATQMFVLYLAASELLPKPYRLVMVVFVVSKDIVIGNTVRMPIRILIPGTVYSKLCIDLLPSALKFVGSFLTRSQEQSGQGYHRRQQYAPRRLSGFLMAIFLCSVTSEEQRAEGELCVTRD